MKTYANGFETFSCKNEITETITPMSKIVVLEPWLPISISNV